jgi:orotate phosphoribosyltransferase
MIAELIWNEISHNSFDFLVAGVPAAGPLGIAPIAGYLSIHRKKPLVIWNEIRFGEASFTSDPTSGKKAIVIHDTVCAGKTLSRIVADVREMGVICDTAVVVVDREEEAKKNLSRQGIELRSVLTLVEIDRYRKEREHE